MPRASDPPLCPSGGAEQPGAVVFGIVGAGEAGGVGYLDRVKPVDAEVLALARPIGAASLYRAAVPCAAGACRHWEGGACQIAARMIRHLDSADGALPACAIRPACRWWRQEGPAACRRCPEVATTPLAPRAVDLVLAGEAGAA